MNQLLTKIVYRYFALPCSECKEVMVPFWHRHCSFCQEGEGRVS